MGSNKDLSIDDMIQHNPGNIPRLDTDLLREKYLEPREYLRMSLSDADEETTINRWTDYIMRKFKQRTEIPSPYYPARRYRDTPKENQLENFLLHCVDQFNPQHYIGGHPNDEYQEMLAKNIHVNHIPDGPNTLSREENCALITEGLRQQPIVIYRGFIYIKRSIY